MSREVDEKVVEMRFDNENFERNAAQSLSTLEKLKRALNFKGAEDGLKNIDAATKSVNMNGLAAGVENVKMHFSALEVIGVTALMNITNRAVDAGLALTRSLTIDQVTSGWQKFADKTTAVQTIMAATASQFNNTEEQMAAVNAQLEKLNWFTDETSYNFVDMVGNIGKFTSNNIDLETSVTAMQGIATWAAISGSNATQASHAMYNLSQAIGVGAVTALDWRSIENANMATAEFKQTAIETAAALGKLKQVGDGVYQTMKGTEVSVSNFREGLSDKWFDNEVLTKTLNKYGEFTDKLNSAVEETGKLTADILGDIEKYREDQEAFKKTVDGTSDSAERYLQILDELSDESMDFGRKAFLAAQETKTFAEVIDYTKDAVSSQWMNIFESIFGEYVSAKKLWTAVAEDFYTIFVKPLENAAGLIDKAFSPKWNDLTDQIVEAGISMEDFKTAVGESFAGGAKGLDELIEKYGSFEAAVASGKISHGVLGNALKGLIDRSRGAAKATDTVTTSIVNLEDVVRRVIRGEFGNGQARIEALTKAGYDYYKVQDLVNKTLAGQVVNYEVAGAAVGDLADLTDEQKARLEELKAELGDTDEAYAKFFAEVQKPSGRELFTGSLRDGLQIVIRMLEIVKGAWRSVFPATTAEQIYHFLEVMKGFTSGTLDGLNNNADKIHRTLRGIFSVIDLLLKLVKGGFKLVFKIANRVLEQFNLNVWDITAAIGDWLVNLHDVILGNKEATGVIDTLIDCLANAIGSVVRFVQKFNLMDKVRVIMTKIGKTMKVTCKSMGDFFKIVGKQVREFISHWKDLDHLDLSTLKAMLKDFKATVIDNIFDFSVAEEKLNSFGNNVKSYFANLGADISSKKAPFISGIVNMFTSVKDYIASKIGFDDVLTAMVAGVDLYAITKLVKAVGNFSEIGAAFKALAGSIGGAFTAIKKYVNSLRTANVIKTVMYIAIALAILTASLVALAYTPIERVDAALARMTALAGILAALAIAVGVMNKLSGPGAAMNPFALIGIAAAMVIVYKVVEMLADMPFGQAMKGVGTMIIMMGAFLVMYALFNAVAARSVAGLKSMFSILALAVAMRLVVDTIIQIKNKLADVHIDDVIEQLGIVFGSLAALGVTSRISGGWKGGLGLLGTVVALKVFLGVLDDIMNVDYDKIAEHINSFIAVYTLIGVLMLETKVAGEHAQKGAAAVLMLSVGMMLIVAVIKQIAELSESELKRGVAVVSVLMLVMGLVILATSKAGPNAAKAGRTLIMMAVAIGLIVACMYFLVLLSKNEKGMNKALFAISVIGAIFVAIIVATKKAGSAKSSLTILAALAALIATLGGILYLLANVSDTNKVKQAAEALAMIVGVFAVLELATSKASNMSINIGSIAILALIVAGLAAVIFVLSKIESKHALKNAEALSVLLVAFSSAMLILSKIGPKADISVTAIGKLAIVVGAISAVLVAIGGILGEIDGAQEFIDGAIPILESVGKALGSFLGGFVAGGLDATIDSFTSFIDRFAASIDKLAVIGENKNTLDALKALADFALKFGASDVLHGLGNILNNPLSAMTGGLIGGSNDSLANLGAQIVKFANSIKGLPKLSEDDKNNAKNVSEVGSALVDFARKVPNAGGLAGLLAGENDDLGEFGFACYEFAKEISKIKDYPITDSIAGSCENISEAGLALVDFARKVPNAGGLAGLLAGENDDLGEFAFSCYEFAKEISKIKDYPITDSIVGSCENVSEAGLALVGFAKKVPNSGGLSGLLSGENDDLGEFGFACYEFVKEISKIKDYPITDSIVDSCENVYDAAAELLDMTSLLSSGAFGNAISATVLEAMAGLADSVIDLAEPLSDMPVIDSNIVSTIENVSDAYEEILDFCEDVLFENSVISRIAANSDVIEEMGQIISLFAESLKDANGIGMMQAWGITRLADVGSAITDFVLVIGKNIGVINAVVEDDSLNKLAGIISNSAPSLVEMSNTLSAIDFNNVSDQINSFSDAMSKIIAVANSTNGNEASTLTNLATSVTSLGSSITGAISSGFSSQASSSFTESITAIINSGYKIISTNFPKFKQGGRLLATNLKAGVSSFGATSIGSAFYSSMSSSISIIRSRYKDFYNAGVYLVQGYINGMRSKTKEANQTAYNLGKSSADYVNKGEKAGSPSKLTTQSGVWFGQGFVNAMASYIPVAESTAEALASSSVDALGESLYAMTDIINKSDSFTPEVTPVLDTTRFVGDVNYLSRQLSSSRAMGLTSSISGEVDANSMILEYINNLDRANSQHSSEVVSAIKGLKQDFRDLGDRIDNLEMVLDSGELVGSISNKMDKAFGKKVSRRNRGV